MSNQTLSHVIHNVIRPFLHPSPPTLDERMHEYVLTINRYWNPVDDPFERYFPLPSKSDAIFRSYVRLHQHEISQYLYERRNYVCELFPETDSVMLERELMAFESFVREHQYDSVQTIWENAVGMMLCDCEELLERSTDWYSIEFVERCVRLWHYSRESADRSDVSVGVWCRMTVFAPKLIMRMLQTRVQGLTSYERKQALDEALATKRQQAFDGVE
jgi:hypothetical protein